MEMEKENFLGGFEGCLPPQKKFGFSCIPLLPLTLETFYVSGIVLTLAPGHPGGRGGS